MMKKRVDVHRVLHVLHQLVQLVARFIEVDRFALARRKMTRWCRSCIQRTPHGGMMVAAVSLVESGTRIPSTRMPKPDRISGC